MSIVAENPDETKALMKKVAKILGSVSTDFGEYMLESILQCCWLDTSDKAKLSQIASTNVSILKSIAPKNELESMLATQLITTHHAVIECYRRAMLPNQTFEGRDMALRHAGKLTKSFADLLSALNKHRGKGQQKITVEHVTVENGAQAIVGNVTGG